MIHRPLLALALLLGPLAATGDEPRQDLLRFSNGDQLHGRLAGIDDRGRILWKREDIGRTVELEPGKLRQIVLNGGRPEQTMESVTHARLVGGDRVPGTIVSLDAETLVVDTPFAGRLSLPRAHVAVLAPQPFGGRIHYAGPFREDGWRILDGPPPPDDGKPDEQEKEAPEPDGGESDDGEPAAPWAFARSAWYSGPTAGDRPLVRDSGMGDSTLLRFQLAWRNQAALSIAFHADFAEPPAKDGEGEEEEEDQAKAPVRRGMLSMPYHFGNCYVLTLHSHYAMMYRCGFDEDGKPFTRRMQNTSNSFRLPQSGESMIELRCDRRSGRILLFVDQEFALQWDESDIPYAGKGGGFGFQITSSSSQIRISEILVAEWNGMIDSARSMEAPDRDVVLLTNGTDRFSGQVTAVRDDHLELASSYAEMKIPLSRVAEIHFAGEALAEAPEPRAEEMVVHLHPVGRISGNPQRADAGHLTLDSPLLGEVSVDLGFAAILDLQPANSFVDDWEIEF